MEPINDYYILFRNHTEGMALYQYIKQHGGVARICPVPRTASECCGMSLLVLPEEIDAVRECIARHNAPHHSIVPLPCQIRPGRGRFC